MELAWILAGMNGLTFLLFAIDKARAVRNGRGKRQLSRVPERVLLLACLMGGSIGGLLAMRLFRHKIRKPKFAIGVPVMLVLQLALAGGIYYYFRRLERTYTGEDFGISTWVSTHDEDADGVDDQTDLLLSARAYLATKPKYKSEYYIGGWPDDGYGVCTDVIARAFLGSGYDLQELVDADIRSNPAGYEIESPDSNIDFRRVRNLKVYFDHTLQSLTCDPYEIADWQGGDIVVWKNHIGMVSDARNKDGICYVLHHGSPAQTSYEQDILLTHGEILAHYRVW